MKLGRHARGPGALALSLFLVSSLAACTNGGGGGGSSFDVRTTSGAYAPGSPIVVGQPDHPASRAIGEIATRVAARLAEAPARAHAPSGPD